MGFNQRILSFSLISLICSFAPVFAVNPQGITVGIDAAETLTLEVDSTQPIFQAINEQNYKTTDVASFISARAYTSTLNNLKMTITSLNPPDASGNPQVKLQGGTQMIPYTVSIDRAIEIQDPCQALNL